MSKITQDFYRAKCKRTIRGLSLFVLILTGAQMSWGQCTGTYKTPDGGYEGQVVGSLGSTSLDNYKWRNYETTGVTTTLIVEDATKARSGARYINVANGNTNVGNPIVTSKFNATRPAASTQYTIQFYYKPTVAIADSDMFATFDPSAYPTTTGTVDGTIVSSVADASGWKKAVSTFTTSATVTTTTCTAGIKIKPATASAAFYDDFVMYPGTEDNTAPDAPTALTVTNGTGQNVIGWAAPGTGVDSGGYLLVRYLGNPSTDSDPKVNGIYSPFKSGTAASGTIPQTASAITASIIDKGTGSVDGVVVYSGATVGYTDVVASPESYYYKLYTVDKAFNYSAEISGTSGLSSPTLVADATANNVDNNIDITFTDDATWRGLVTAVSVNGTNLSASDYVLSAGNLQLKPSNGNALLTTAGTKAIAIMATGYTVAAVSQNINVGALDTTKSTVTLVAGPLAPSATKTMNCTAKDQYSNLISGYQFKYDATITNANINTAESYTIDGTAQIATANDVNLVALTNASGLASFTIALPAVIDGGDGVSVQVQLNDGATNVGSAATYIQTTTTWNGTAWSNGVPSTSIEAIIDGTYSGAAFDAKKLTINSGKSLTINSGTNVTVQNEVINNGSLVVENNANLIQVNNTTNTGNVTVNRNSNPLYRLDYTIWSSPVFGTQTLAQFSPSTSQSPNRFYTYDTTNNLYDNTNVPTTATFGKAAGYLIRMPNTDPTTNYDAGTATLAYPGVFTGVLNNGTVSKSISDTGSGYNMVGNPYSSTISADAFMTANTASIESTLYFWRKTNLAGGSAYATYTPIGGASSTASASGVILTPNGTIQVGQGFFVKAKTGATSVSFTNAMRETTPTSTQFFKTKQVNQVGRVWLNLTNPSGAFSQALVGYTANATLGVDGYDGLYFNDSPLALTSNINGGEYTIQGRPAFDATDVVPLNFKTDVAGDYTIAIDHADGVFAAGQDVVLVDNTTGTETSLTTSSYSFTAAAGTANSRFALKYQKTLGTNKSVLSDNNVTVYKNKGTLYVNAGNATIANIKVYDVQGRLVAELKNVKVTSTTIANLKATNQVLVVKITLQDNKVVTKKVVN